MGSAAPATAPQSVPVVLADPEPAIVATPAPAPAVAKSSDDLRNAVLSALSGQPMLVAMLESGEWKAEGSEVVVKVASSAAVIDMSVSADAKRAAGAAASGALGRPVKLRVVPGGTVQATPAAPRSNGNGRTKAEQDPIVQKMREKFGAEIRTVIDYTKRN